LRGKQSLRGWNIKSPIVPYAFKKVKWLPEPVLRGVFPEHHVVTAARRDKDDGRHVVEALDPLPPLVSLPADIKHAAKRGKHTVSFGSVPGFSHPVYWRGGFLRFFAVVTRIHQNTGFFEKACRQVFSQALKGFSGFWNDIFENFLIGVC